MIHFSVHLITYNNEKHIEETISSILSQRVNFNFEIVVGDDCSTDNTLKIINKYKEKHPELFNVLQNKNQLGILKNFFKTVQRCNGDYFFALAGDDILKSPESLQKMYNVISKENSLGFIDSGFDKYYDNSNKTIVYNNKKIINARKDDYIKAIFMGEIAPIGLCFNRKLLLKHVDFQTYINKNITIDDYPILVDLAMHTDFKRIDESLVIYRVHDDSFSHEVSFEKHYKLTIQMKSLFEYFSKKYFFNNELINIYNRKHFKQLLFYAGFFQKKELGIDVFDKIKHKSAKDYIHYFASQNKIFRKLVSLF